MGSRALILRCFGKCPLAAGQCSPWLKRLYEHHLTSELDRCDNFRSCLTLFILSSPPCFAAKLGGRLPCSLSSYSVRRRCTLVTTATCIHACLLACSLLPMNMPSSSLSHAHMSLPQLKAMLPGSYQQCVHCHYHELYPQVQKEEAQDHMATITARLYF